MANVAHSTLTGSNLHENKGVSSATDNTVATAVSNATVWAKLTADNLTGTGNSFGAQLYHVRYQQNSGTDGGSLTTSTWTKYPIATEVTDEITSSSLTSNVISLPAGTYYLEGRATFRNPNNVKLRLRDTTNSATKIIGMSLNYSSAANTGPVVPLCGRFTLAGTANLEIQYWASNNNGTNALGIAVTSGEIEVYGDFLFWKVA